MWNGLWKLTVMVGVIGIGLFAAYQAQKGMNLTQASAPSEPADAKSERVLESTDDKPSFDLSTDQDEPVVISKSELEPTVAPQPKKIRSVPNRRPIFLMTLLTINPSQKTAASNKIRTA